MFTVAVVIIAIFVTSIVLCLAAVRAINGSEKLSSALSSIIARNDR